MSKFLNWLVTPFMVAALWLAMKIMGPYNVE